MSLNSIKTVPVWFRCKQCKLCFNEIHEFIRHKNCKHSIEFEKAECIIFEDIGYQDDQHLNLPESDHYFASKIAVKSKPTFTPSNSEELDKDENNDEQQGFVIKSEWIESDTNDGNFPEANNFDLQYSETSEHADPLDVSSGTLIENPINSSHFFQPQCNLAVFESNESKSTSFDPKQTSTQSLNVISTSDVLKVESDQSSIHLVQAMTCDNESSYAIKYVCQVNPAKKTSQHTEKLDRDGYCYNRRKTQNGTTYWRCDQRRICEASVIENSKGFGIGRSHWSEDGQRHLAHPPDIVRCRAERARAAAKRFCMDQPELPVNEIYSNATANEDLHVQVLLPAKQDFKRMIRRYRQSYRQNSANKKVKPSVAGRDEDS